MPAIALKPVKTAIRFNPVLGVAPNLKISNAVLAKAKRIDYSSESRALQTLKTQKFSRKSMSGVIQHAFSGSGKQGETLIKAYANSWKNDGSALEDAAVVMNVARVSKVTQRRTILRALIAKKKAEYVVHNIGGMSPNDAKSVMLDYFNSGGSASDVATWLADASRYLDENDTTTLGTDGIWGSIKKGLKAVADWTKGAIKTVGNALSAAAKKLGEAVEVVAGWTLSKVKDFVKGLIRAGRSVSAILAEAIKHGQAALNKFVNALLAAGKTISSIASWAAGKTSAILKNVISGVIAAGKAVSHIISQIAGLAADKIKIIIRALLQLGRTLGELVKTVAALTLSRVKNVINALIALGKKVSAIVVEAVKATRIVLSKVMEGLLSLGRRMSELVAAAVSLAITATRKVVAELLRLGKSIVQMMAAALAQSSLALRRIARALVSAAASVVDVLKSVASTARAMVVAAIRGILDAGVSVLKLAKQLSEFAGSRLLKLVNALYTATRKLDSIIKGFIANTLSAARTLIEGLLAAGANFVKTVAGILKNVATGNYSNFFEALKAIGRGLLEVAVQALKLGGAILVAAFSAVLEVFGGHRPLTRAERSEAKKVFGVSIDLSRVKISVASIPADIISKFNDERPFTTMYVINFKSGTQIETQTLIHELTHVWQAKQRGPIYAVEALHAQFKLGPDAYKVTDQNLIAADGDFSKFNPEQQATIVDRYWAAKFGGNNPANPVGLLEPYARQVFKSQRFEFPTDRLIPIKPPVLRPVRVLPRFS